MGKYTPGPWKCETVFDRKGNPCAYSVWPCNQSGVRHRICMTPDGTTCENFSNAQLISAAPDLLDAAQTALECLEGGGFGKAYAEDVLRAAIRKAEGE